MCYNGLDLRNVMLPEGGQAPKACVVWFRSCEVVEQKVQRGCRGWGRRATGWVGWARTPQGFLAG